MRHCRNILRCQTLLHCRSFQLANTCSSSEAWLLPAQRPQHVLSNHSGSAKLVLSECSVGGKDCHRTHLAYAGKRMIIIIVLCVRSRVLCRMRTPDTSVLGRSTRPSTCSAAGLRIQTPRPSNGECPVSSYCPSCCLINPPVPLFHNLCHGYLDSKRVSGRSAQPYLVSAGVVLGAPIHSSNALPGVVQHSDNGCENSTGRTPLLAAPAYPCHQ